MAIASGVAKQLRYKKEVTWGTAPGTTGGQLLRRVTSNLELAKNTYQSAEIVSNYQLSDYRHGLRRVDGGINGELSAGTYADFFAAALRRLFTTGATTGASTAIVASAGAPHFTRGGGSYFTDGFKVGDVVRWTGWTTTGAPNNNVNYTITALTSTAMTVDGVVAAKAAGDSVTCTVSGKKTFVPTTGHTDESFYFEEWYSNITQSHQFSGCKIATMDLSLPSEGMSTINMTFLGKDLTTGTAAYFTAPAASTTTGVMAAVNGKVFVDNTAIGIMTNADLTITSNLQPTQVIGSNVQADISPQRVIVTGRFGMYFETGTYRDDFINESEISLYFQLKQDNTANSNLLNFVLPRIKLGSFRPDDGEKSIMAEATFQALYNGAGGTGLSTEATTISIQDTSI